VVKRYYVLKLLQESFLSNFAIPLLQCLHLNDFTTEIIMTW